MSIQSAFRESGIPFPANAMNLPEDGWDGIADIKTFPDTSQWVVCPWCGKKAVRLLPDTHIHMMPWKCRNNKCKKEFIVNLEKK